MTTRTYDIDTEYGSHALIDVHHDQAVDVYTLNVHGELVDAAPEALTAAIQLAMLEVRAERRQ